MRPNTSETREGRPPHNPNEIHIVPEGQPPHDDGPFYGLSDYGPADGQPIQSTFIGPDGEFQDPWSQHHSPGTHSPEISGQDPLHFLIERFSPYEIPPGVLPSTKPIYVRQFPYRGPAGCNEIPIQSMNGDWDGVELLEIRTPTIEVCYGPDEGAYLIARISVSGIFCPDPTVQDQNPDTWKLVEVTIGLELTEDLSCLGTDYNAGITKIQRIIRHIAGYAQKNNPGIPIYGITEQNPSNNLGAQAGSLLEITNFDRIPVDNLPLIDLGTRFYFYQGNLLGLTADGIPGTSVESDPRTTPCNFTIRVTTEPLKPIRTNGRRGRNPKHSGPQQTPLPWNCGDQEEEQDDPTEEQEEYSDETDEEPRYVGFPENPVEAFAINIPVEGEEGTLSLRDALCIEYPRNGNDQSFTVKLYPDAEWTIGYAHQIPPLDPRIILEALDATILRILLPMSNILRRDRKEILSHQEGEIQEGVPWTDRRGRPMPHPTGIVHRLLNGASYRLRQYGNMFNVHPYYFPPTDIIYALVIANLHYHFIPQPKKGKKPPLESAIPITIQPVTWQLDDAHQVWIPDHTKMTDLSKEVQWWLAQRKDFILRIAKWMISGLFE